MATEDTQSTTPETPEEEEYRRPNPQDNPRNIALAEVAKTVAAQHAQAAGETAPSIDDEGNVTPPPAETPLNEAAAAVPAEEPAGDPSPETPSPASETAPAAPPPIEPEKMYKVKVDGQEVEVPGKAIIDAGFRTFQKETAADFRLKMASELLREAEAKVRGTPQAIPEAPAVPKQQEKSDAELANALQFGTPEQAAEALSALRGRGAVTPEQVQQFAAQQARIAAKDELLFQDAMNFVKTEYADLLANDYLKRLFFVEENRRRAPKERGGEADPRPYKDLYKSIGDDLRKAFNLSKPGTSPSGSPTPPGTAAARQERKAQAVPVPRTAASRLQEAAAAVKVPTPSEIIAGMAANRGKNQLSQQRKGT
jgi:hypothetical protein